MSSIKALRLAGCFCLFRHPGGEKSRENGVKIFARKQQGAAGKNEQFMDSLFIQYLQKKANFI